MWLCPLLSVLRFFFLFPGVLKGDLPISKGKSHYTRYDMLLPIRVKQLETQIKILGFEAGDLGSHSCCKRVATMVATGCTLYPPIVVLFIWAGWVFGGVKDNYLFRDRSGDKYAGRCASCLDQLKKGFCSFPTTF